jgi:hypothetical protein
VLKREERAKGGEQRRGGREGREGGKVEKDNSRTHSHRSQQLQRRRVRGCEEQLEKQGELVAEREEIKS